MAGGARQRWLARLSILLMIAPLILLIVFSGEHGHGIGLVVTGVVGACLMVAAGYWFLVNRGAARWAAFTLGILVPVALIWAYATRRLLWVAIVSVALLLAALISARAAMGTARRE